MAQRNKERSRHKRRDREINKRIAALPKQSRLAFECLEQRLLLAADFGDAPAPYRTLLAENGARHDAVGPMLGAWRDSEPDGLPSLAADGDGADDNGVTIGPLRVGQVGAQVFVTVSGIQPGQQVRLDGWIDFDADGNWGGPLEQVFDGKIVTAGTHQLDVNVPAWAAVGTTYARFRISSHGVTGPNGAVNNGEVEDYAVVIDSPLAGPATFAERPISYSQTGVSSIAAVDMDGDGDQDLLASDFSSGRISWHENDGNGVFIQRVVTNNSSTSARLAPADFNGDGHIDVLQVSEGVGPVLWFVKNTSAAGGYVVSSTGLFGRAAVPVDMEGDGDFDVVVASQNSIVWRPAGTNVTNVIDSTATGAIDVDAADIDRDGDVDVLGASADNNTLSWYQNNGAQSFTRRVITDQAAGIFRASLVDLDADGDLDALATLSTGGVLWFENDGAENFASQSIAAIAHARDASAADVDGDGDLDLVVSVDLLGGAQLMLNDGDQNFTPQSLPPVAANAHTFAVADFDGDGVLDIARGATSGTPLAWLRQEVPLDFGDAAENYPTTLAEGGARHHPVGPTLGSLRDSELDGAHSAAADSDGDDEDGATFSVIAAGDASATVVVTVQNASQGAQLDAWIDFDGDGTWSRPEERIATDLPVVDGANVVTFAVPAWAAAGQSVARFRLSTAGNLGPAGVAFDGEVEDYVVTIDAPSRGSGLFGPLQSNPSPNIGMAQAVDLDRDGDMDFLVPESVVWSWHENDGAGVFTKRQVFASGGSQIEYISAADFDGDGDVDVLTKDSNLTRLFLNNGVQTFAVRNVANSYGMTPPVVVDFEGDGDLDLLVASTIFANEPIFMLENSGNGTFVQRELITSTPSRRFLSLAVADADGDGDLDVFAAPKDDVSSRLELFVNQGDDSFTAKTLAVYPSPQFLSIAPADLDQDGDVDFVAGVNGTFGATNASQVSWLENLGGNNFSLRFIANLNAFASFSPTTQVLVADVEGDGDLDIATSSPGIARVAWHENLGNRVFAQRTISADTSSTFRPQGIALADLNGDGRLDLFIASEYSHTVGWRPQLAAPAGDYGDAPQPYPIRPSAGGPIHQAVGPTLGALRDEELVAENSVDAAGDDDDGVITTALQPGQIDATFTISIQNAPAGAYLDAWIDFDGDGSWSRAEERIAAGVAVVEGVNSLTFDVPTWAAAGTTYARFRLSTAGDLSYVGPAADGEVEDYAVTIDSPATAVGPYLEHHSIAVDGDNARVVVAVDLDRDGDVDVVTAPAAFGSLYWYENQGAAGYQRHTISISLPASSMVAADMDSDGDLDLVVSDIGLYWLENDGAQHFTARSTSFNTSTTTQHLYAADVDGDGDMDLLTSNHRYLNNGQQNFFQVRHSSSTLNGGSVFPADLDRDGDLDLIARNTSTGIVLVTNSDGGFSERTLSADAFGVFPFSVADVDGDGDLDLLGLNLSGTSTVRWFENDGNLEFTQHVVGSLPSGSVRGAFPADFDGDGDVDFVIAMTGETAWFENDGQQNFTKHTAPSPAIGSTLADMNGDGRLDLVVSTPSPGSPTGGGLAWYSLTDRRVSVSPTVAVVQEEDQSTITVTFTREGDVSVAAEFFFTFTNTATPGEDYTVSGADIDATGGAISFAPGEDSVDVHFTVIDDNLKELTEWIRLTLLPAAGYAVGAGSIRLDIRSSEMAGDFNDDQFVDGADFLQWQRTLGDDVDPPGSGADGDGNGIVDGVDLQQTWMLNFGQQVVPVGIEAASAASSEPATANYGVAIAALGSSVAFPPNTVLSAPSLGETDPRSSTKALHRHQALDEVFRRSEHLTSSRVWQRDAQTSDSGPQSIKANIRSVKRVPDKASVSSEALAEALAPEQAIFRY